MWVEGLVLSVAVFAVVLLSFRLWDKWQARDAPLERPGRIGFWFSRLSPRLIRAIFTIAIFALWVPAFLAFFPGNYSSDGPLQVSALLNEGFIDLHWPAVHTLVLAGCLELGRSVANSFDFGLSVYCIGQGLLLAFSMAFAAERAIRWKVPAPFVVATTLVMALNPVLQTYAFTTTKDSMFAAFFLIVLVYLAEMVRDPARFLESTPSLVRFALAVLATCLMRKQGAYVLVVVGVVAFVWLARPSSRVRFAVAIVVPLAAAFLCNPLISLLVPTRSDSERETLSVPSQQVARTYMLDYDSLTTGEIEWYSRYYDIAQFESGRLTTAPYASAGNGRFYDTITGTGYLDCLADLSKGALNDAAYAEDKLGYLSGWMALARGHEGLYSEAFLWGEVGYVYPSSKVANRWTGMSPWNEFSVALDEGGAANQIADYHQTSLLPGYLSWLVDGTQNIFPENPLLMLWVSMALPFYVLLASFCLLARRRGSSLLIAWMLLFVYWLSLGLGPVMCIRYVTPLFYCLPFAASLPLMGSRA
jgi:hypothetical protein